MRITEESPVTLSPHPDNPRAGDVGAIVESIKKNGWHGVVVCQQSTRRILVGNHRVKAALILGLEKIPVQWADVDDNRAKAILLADNRASDLGGYDDEVLARLVYETAVDGLLDSTGYDLEDMDRLVRQAMEPGPMDLDEKKTECPMCGHRFYAVALGGRRGKRSAHPGGSKS
jgi:ParB-like chromosome segregation protein Spo0J